MTNTFTLDGEEIPFTAGQSVLQAALAAGHYVPHLCAHPEFRPHGSCRVCMVRANGRFSASCTLPAQPGLVVESETSDVRALRREIVRLLFVEGNHFCPSCEKSGDCKLQAVAYQLEVKTLHFTQLFPDRPVDASHPDLVLDFNRCILCELCVRASADIDGRHVFALSGRGIPKHLIVNAESGSWSTRRSRSPIRRSRSVRWGVILKRGRAFSVPIGQRTYDLAPIDAKPAQGEP
ncbi:MAG: (2Fe-2S)-binding protein [Gemmatimonadetes bacterium]|nr:(2Fe-2S)-binding protein [Gemmatimonadota bacterium]